LEIKTYSISITKPLGPGLSVGVSSFCI